MEEEKNKTPIDQAKEKTKALATQGQGIVEQARIFLIETEEDMRQAVEIMTRIKANIKTIKDELNPVCKSTNDAHKKATTLRSKLLAPFKTAGEILEGKASAFQKKMKEEETAAINGAIETQKQETEELREAARQEAIEFKQMGDEEMAELMNLEAQTMQAPLPAVQSAPQKYQGENGTLSFTPKKKVKVLDKRKLVIEMLKGTKGKLALFDTAVSINIPAIEKHLMGTSFKGADIPGLYIEEDEKANFRVKTKVA